MVKRHIRFMISSPRKWSPAEMSIFHEFYFPFHHITEISSSPLPSPIFLSHDHFPSPSDFPQSNSPYSLITSPTSSSPSLLPPSHPSSSTLHTPIPQSSPANSQPSSLPLPDSPTIQPSS